MSINTKFYAFSHPNAPKLYNNSKWGELIKVIRYAVNGGEWYAKGITKISYDRSKQFIRVYMDNNPRVYSNYQTIEFNENCGVFSGKEAIIRLVTSTFIDITLHDKIEDLPEIHEVETSGMNIRVAKLGFTEAFTDRDCGVFKTENHDFYFCLNDNNPSNDDFTFTTDNKMMTRPTVYMCEGMDSIHAHIGEIYPYDTLYPAAHIGGDAYKMVNSTIWQNGLMGWDYEWGNSNPNKSFSEIKWWLIGNGDSITLILENPNSSRTTYRCYMFQVVHNGREYTPIMNGTFNSMFNNFYDRFVTDSNNRHYYNNVSTTFGIFATYNSYNRNKVYMPTTTFVSNTVILKSYSNGTPKSVYLYPTIYATNRYSGNAGMSFDTYDREFCHYNIMVDNTMEKTGLLNNILFNNNIASTLMNGEIVRMVDSDNREHLFFHFIDRFHYATNDYSINDTYSFTSCHTEYNIRLFIDLLGND